MLVETNCPNVLATADNDATLLLRQALERACRSHGGDAVVLSITAVQLAAILPNCERRQAVALANEVLAELGDLAGTRGRIAGGPHRDAQCRRGDGRGRAQELRPLAARRKCGALPLRRPLVQHERGEEH